MTQPGTEDQGSGTETADNEPKPSTALDTLRNRMGLDLGVTTLPYVKRVVAWKAPENLLFLFVAVLFLGIGALSYPGFSGAFERSVTDGLVLWAVTIFGFGVGLALLAMVISTFFEGLTIAFSEVSVTARDRRGKLILEEPIANYLGVSLLQDVTKVYTKGGTAAVRNYQVDLDHPEEAKVVPLYRGALNLAIERRDQACHLFGLPKTGEDYEPQTTEEAILQSHSGVAGLVNTYRKHKRDRRDPDRRNEGE